MKKIVFTVVMAVGMYTATAQNLELRSNKDLKQPGLVNPSLAGLQENLFRVLTQANLDDFSLMVEGRIPFNLGNYMMGFERVSNGDVKDNMINITYGRNVKKSEALKFRYGGSMEFHTRSSIHTTADTAVGFRFTDLNGEVTEFQNLAQITGDLTYVNLDFGASVTYQSLLVSAAVANVFSPDVSLLKGEKRKLPLQANATVGGFLDLGVLTFFPHAIAVYSNQEVYARLGLDMYSKYFNLSAFYTHDNIQQDISITLASHYKKTFFGISYAQPLNQSNGVGDIRVFLNSNLFKGLDLFRSGFAQQIEKFY